MGIVLLSSLWVSVLRFLKWCLLFGVCSIMRLGCYLVCVIRVFSGEVSFSWFVLGLFSSLKFVVLLVLWLCMVLVMVMLMWLFRCVLVVGGGVDCGNCV